MKINKILISLAIMFFAFGATFAAEPTYKVEGLYSWNPNKRKDTLNSYRFYFYDQNGNELENITIDTDLFLDEYFYINPQPTMGAFLESNGMEGVLTHDYLKGFYNSLSFACFYDLYHRCATVFIRSTSWLKSGDYIENYAKKDDDKSEIVRRCKRLCNAMEFMKSGQNGRGVSDYVGFEWQLITTATKNDFKYQTESEMKKGTYVDDWATEVSRERFDRA